MVTEFFVVTTDYDQANYFSGESGIGANPPQPSGPMLPPGDYRVMDGELLPVLSGLTLDEVRARLSGDSRPDDE